MKLLQAEIITQVDEQTLIETASQLIEHALQSRLDLILIDENTRTQTNKDNDTQNKVRQKSKDKWENAVGMYMYVNV